uniref:PID domain-containing protein n=1 Tax=Xenopus tropicalis TaxID=8364 RepID=A0A1B8Y0L3_XENTR|eukprot:XP_004913383.1 PREDICTED: protein FAM43B [Xenopus tropicalis]
MLPWRRKGKFVLAQKEQNGKALSYPSLLPSFLRSCPDLLPNISGQCLGTMFGRKRRTVELTREEPSDKGRYLGSAVTLRARGEGCTAEAVGQIWERSGGGSRGPRVRLLVSSEGIRVTPGKGKPAHTYLLHRITHCGTDSAHPRLLSWVYRHQVRHKAVVLRCHTVLLSRQEKAAALALRLCQISRAAFCDFKRLKRQNDFRRGQQERLGQCVVPLVPLRRVLNARCYYHPREVRGSGALGLSSILEEEEDGEEEQKNPTCDLPGNTETMLDLAQELRRLSIQRALTQSLNWTYSPPVCDWKCPIRTIC